MNNKIAELIKEFHPHTSYIPIDRKELQVVVEKLYDLMFPICKKMEVSDIHRELLYVGEVLTDNISRITSQEFAENAMERFFSEFSEMQQRLAKDSQCYLDNDPAAKSLVEVILTYPGFFALCVHRIAHKLHQLKVPLIPRLFSEYAHSKVGIDIHPGAQIGKNLFMDHGTGIVIGETTVVGNNVKIYQGVTLGALYLEKKLSSVKRHPTVEDNVVIYAAATILGGDTVIGHHSTIGGGTWLTKSVIPYSLVYNKVDVKIKTVKDFEEPNDFVI